MTTGQGQMRETYPFAGEAYRYRTAEDDRRFTFSLEGDDPTAPEESIALEIDAATGEGLCRTESGLTVPFAWAWVGAELHLWLDGDLFVFQREESRRRSGRSVADAAGDILAPMPGAVLEVLVAEGDRVERNQTVVLMESMKMELVITASRAGVVRRVSVEPGQQVDRGMRLLELGPEGDGGEGR